jgi:hypothetical protein
MTVTANETNSASQGSTRTRLYASRGWRVVRGRPADAAWVGPALAALLGGTALLYLWGLGNSGWASNFYSAWTEASKHSWKAS